jgi:hypothetical protein
MNFNDKVHKIQEKTTSPFNILFFKNRQLIIRTG